MNVDTTKKWVSNIIKVHRECLHECFPNLTIELVMPVVIAVAKRNERKTRAGNESDATYLDIRESFMEIGYDIER